LKEIKTSNVPLAVGPYSQAIITNNMVFTSGQIPINPLTGEIPDGIELQANQVFLNLKNLLEASGTSMDKVVKTTVFINNMENFLVLNKIYETYFSAPYPARSCVEVSKLPKDVLVEVEAIAEI
jgi:2-iminobutanoate/2-iminopropanoate deaminase